MLTPGVRSDDAKREEAVRLAAEGKSQLAIAEELGVSPATVNRWLKDGAFTVERAVRS